MRDIEDIIAEEPEGYLLNDYEDAVIRFKKNMEGRNDWYLKFKGKEEDNVNTSHRIVFDAILEGEFITKEEYEAF